MIYTLDIKLFIQNSTSLPIVDVRSPYEYNKGHFPRAISFPLFTNLERTEIGTLYKQKGKAYAVERGLELVGPKLAFFVRELTSLAPNKKIILYCWRGGMRSNSMAWLLNLSGFDVYVLKKGYQSFRNYVLDFFKQPFYLMLLGGKTGSGKTILLHRLKENSEQIIDLEYLAQHKGSVFGGLDCSTQPSTEQFENNLVCELYTLDRSRPIWVEDESRMIGTVCIPEGFWKQMRQAPVAFLEVEKEKRINQLVQDYSVYGYTQLAEAIHKIKKRLGGQYEKKALEALRDCNFNEVASLLLTYYDKGYIHGLSKRDPSQVETFLVDSLYSQQLVDELKKWACKVISKK